ncbi:MAG: exodeoxyribonuclease VII large subunit [Nanoarchaeota archaeon]|nr:exodeoxyribonuclease VII large subunit [Nanoarchaeota archaeon]
METNQKIPNIPESKIITIDKLTDYIKQKLENDSQLINIWVRGEISNYTLHSSGHSYFTLKDETSQISCIMFRDSVSSLKFDPEHGMKVLVLSSLNVYKPRGNYQLVVSEMYQDGLGELHQKFLQLKEKLEKEGLFSKEYKKPIPKFPRTIGIITSPTGAVVRDLIRNLTRRFPNINIKLVPTLVQGGGAAENIVKSIELLNKIKGVDIIILGRGGGSLEDLWCFNEEIVARAIFKSKIPIISAVGHETDFTISDFVADYRAPTPSTAAEIAVKDKNELLSNINHLRERLLQKTKRTIELKRQHLKSFMDRPIFKRPLDFINQHLQQIDELILRSDRAILQFLKLKRHDLEILTTKLDNLNPEAVLERGYSLTMCKGKVIKSTKDVKINDLIDIILRKGEIKSKVMEVKNGKRK